MRHEGKETILDLSIIDSSSIGGYRLEVSTLLYRLKIADQQTTQLFEKKLGISLTRYEILQVLLEKAPCSQVTLQESLQIDQAAITRHLRILEEEGYILRQRNPKNQRELLVSLTTQTQSELVTSPSPEHLRIKQQIEELLSQDEINHLSSILDKLVKGFDNITF